jgi:outer membrane protein
MGIRSLGSRVVLGAIAGLLVSASALAADLKIAYVDQRQAIASSTRGQEAQKILTDLAAKMQGELQPQQEEYQRLGSELEAQRYVLTGDAIEERRIELEKKRRDLERELQKAQEELQIEERKMLAPLVKQIGEAIKEIGKDKDFALILDRSSPGVLYMEDGLDITELVIKLLNKD